MLRTMTCSFHAHGCAADQHARDASLRATSCSNCLECRAVPSASPMRTRSLSQCDLAGKVNTSGCTTSRRPPAKSQKHRFVSKADINFDASRHRVYEYTESAVRQE